MHYKHDADDFYFNDEHGDGDFRKNEQTNRYEKKEGKGIFFKKKLAHSFINYSRNDKNVDSRQFRNLNICGPNTPYWLQLPSSARCR